jgi:hypothetical protein
MAQSLKRKIKRGHIVMIWNSTMQKMDFFKKSSRGPFITCNGFTGTYTNNGPGVHAKTIEKWKESN